MPVHIGQLISNVTVARSSASNNRPATDPTALDLVLRTSSDEPVTPGQPVASDVQSDGPEASPSVDPKALADRVYQLMVQEVVIARERE